MSNRQILSREPNAQGQRASLITRIAIGQVEVSTQVDGVTRCLARLLAHLREQGHEAVVLGPQSGMVSSPFFPF